MSSVGADVAATVASLATTTLRRRLLNLSGFGGETTANMVRLLRLLPQISLPLTILHSVLTLVVVVLPTLFILATGVIVGTIAEASAGGLSSPAGRRLMLAVLVAGVLFVAQQIIAPVWNQLMLSFSRRVDAHLAGRVLNASLQPAGIAHLEDPETLDRINQSRGVGTGSITPGRAVDAFSDLAVARLSAVGSAILLIPYSVPLAVALVGFRVWSRRIAFRTMRKSLEATLGLTQERRQSDYLRNLGLTPGAAKETRVFGLGPWLVSRFSASWDATMQQVWQARKGAGWQSGYLTALIFAVDVLAFAMLARSAANGDISLGQLTVYIQAAFGVAQLGIMSTWEHTIMVGSASVPAALAIEKIGAQASLDGGTSAQGLPQQAIRFEGVRFTYPGSDRPVLNGLDLEIVAGESLAIVGANGAGKTTIIKLLARLYDPTAGRITVDGGDLKELDPRAWQRRLAAIFQDFVRYELPARENVGFGHLPRLKDQELLDTAAELAGASDLIKSLEHGWDTVLSRGYEGGVDLSGGQWQRVALARALAAAGGGAGVLVLDEPTANLDVRAEADLFDRFLDLTAGLTTVLISHRFSTVRRASRVAVVEHGRLVEQGSHDELMAANARYARMFRLQAERFQDAPAEVTGG